VRLVYERRAAGVSMKQVAPDLEVRLEQLHEWARQLRGRSSVRAMETPEQELRHLRRDCAKTLVVL
jgi:hypothetical protein